MQGNVFWSSDWHIFHKRIQEYCPYTRQGETPEQMTEMIIHNISTQVKPGDVIYNLGDVSFGTEDQTESALKQIKKMRVQHHLIFGNHDKAIRKSQKLQDQFTSISDIKEITIDKQVFVMSHMKMTTWNRSSYGSIHLHGHLHSTYQPNFDRALDVGIDTRGGMKMYSYEEVMSIMSFCKRQQFHH